jgi:hypothetical protein
MFAVSWTVDTPSGKPGRMFYGGIQRFGLAEQTSILDNASHYHTREEAETMMVSYAAKNPELLGRFEVVLVKYKDVGYGKMKAYWERV